MSRYQFEEKNQIVELVENSKWIIRTLASLIGLYYGWVKFEGFDIEPLINQVSTELLIKVSLGIYYFSWTFGTTLDGADQGEIFHKVFNNGKIPRLGIFIALTVAISFFILCGFWESNYLPIALISFWTIDVLLGLIFTRFVMKPYYDINKDFYNKKNYLTKRKFEIVEEFLFSEWNIYRYLIGYLILIIIIILSLTDWANFLIIGDDKQFYIALLILVFVLTVELWIWFFRLKRKFSLMVINELIDKKNFR